MNNIKNILLGFIIMLGYVLLACLVIGGLKYGYDTFATVHNVIDTVGCMLADISNKCN